MNTFVLGRRFEKFRNLCLVVVGALVFGFYFIYDYLYESFPVVFTLRDGGRGRK